MIYNKRKHISGHSGWTGHSIEGLVGGITKRQKKILRVMDMFITLIMKIYSFISV